MSAELPDFSTYPAWLDSAGDAVDTKEILSALSAEHASWSPIMSAPWVPLMTAKDWAKQRDDIATAAAELSERTLMTASEAMAVLIAATDWIGAEKLTRDQWVQRIDPHELAGVLDSCFPGCDGPAAEDFIERYIVSAVDAVLAALPELMGGGSDD